MTLDTTKIAFTSEYISDKVVYESPVLTYSQGASSFSTQTVANPYGVKALTTLAWSVDGTNYYPANATISVNYVTQYTANGSCSASNVHIYLENNTGGAITFYIKFALDTIT